MKLIFTYLFIINLIGFLLMYIDKQKAIKHKWRIKEATLLGVAIIGGSLGVLLGMYNFKHKTKHKLFTMVIPFILILQVLLFISI